MGFGMGVSDAVFAAASTGDVVTVRHALGTDAHVVHTLGPDGDTLLAAAARAGHCEVVRLLLAGGANPSTAGVRGETALHAAVARGCTACCVALLHACAYPAALDGRGCSPMQHAAGAGSTVVLDLLLDAAVDRLRPKAVGITGGANAADAAGSGQAPLAASGQREPAAVPLPAAAQLQVGGLNSQNAEEQAEQQQGGEDVVEDDEDDGDKQGAGEEEEADGGAAPDAPVSPTTPSTQQHAAEQLQEPRQGDSSAADAAAAADAGAAGGLVREVWAALVSAVLAGEQGVTAHLLARMRTLEAAGVLSPRFDVSLPLQDYIPLDRFRTAVAACAPPGHPPPPPGAMVFKFYESRSGLAFVPAATGSACCLALLLMESPVPTPPLQRSHRCHSMQHEEGRGIRQHGHGIRQQQEQQAEGARHQEQEQGGEARRAASSALAAAVAAVAKASAGGRLTQQHWQTYPERAQLAGAISRDSSMLTAAAASDGSGGLSRSAGGHSESGGGNSNPKPCPLVHSILDAEGWTLLMASSCAGQEQCVDLLLSLGADVSAASLIGRSALWLASLNGHLSCVRRLLVMGADPEQCEQVGFPPLMAALVQGHVEVAQQLRDCGAQLDARSRGGLGAVGLAARYGQLEALEWLLAQGADMEAADNQKMKPVQLAAREAASARDPESRERCRAAVALLMSRGARLSPECCRDLFKSLGGSQGWRTSWEVLANCVAPHQVWALTSDERFYGLSRGSPPPPPQPAAAGQQLRGGLPPTPPACCPAVDVVLRSVSQMLDSFLFQLSPTDNKCLGRRPAYLLTLLANGTTAAAAAPSARGEGASLSPSSSVSSLSRASSSDSSSPPSPRAAASGRHTVAAGGGGQQHHHPAAPQLPEEWRTTLLRQWGHACALFEVVENATLDGPATSDSASSLAARLGNLITAFHDARRLLWPATQEEGGGGSRAAAKGGGERAGRPLADFLMSRRPFLNTLVASPAASSDLVAWHSLLEYPALLDPPNKRLLLQSELRLAHHVAQPPPASPSLPNGGGGAVLEAPRSGILQRLCTEYSAGGGLAEGGLLQGLSVKFEGEAGVGDGIRRDWFRLVSSEFLDPSYGLMESPDGGRSFQPAGHADLQEGSSTMFEMLGRLCGLAVLHGCHLPGCHLTRPLLRLVLGQRPCGLSDLAAADPQLASCLRMLESGDVHADELHLTFATHDVFGRTVELVPGGESIDVTESNKGRYIDLLINHKLLGGAGGPGRGSGPADFFLRGWASVVPARVQDIMARCVTPEELDVMLAGVDVIDPSAWRRAARYHGCSAGSLQVQWLWAEVESMTSSDLGALLAFVTGSSSLPAGGFDALQGFNGGRAPFTVHLVSTEGDCRLPRARTCFNSLYLPAYSSRRVLADRLLQAVHSQSVFDEALWQ